MEQQNPEQKPRLYDPKLKYNWEPTDQFTFTGVEFHNLYNGLLPLARLLAPAMTAFQVMQAKLEQNVDAGLIHPAPQQPQAQPAPTAQAKKTAKKKTQTIPMPERAGQEL